MSSLPSSESGASFPFSASGLIDGIKFKVTGFFITEVGGSTAFVRFREATVGGPIFLAVKLVAGESVGDMSTMGGILVTGGVYVEVVSGTVIGAVYGR